MALNVPVHHVRNPTSTVIKCTWVDVSPDPTVNEIPEVPNAFMHFYSGVVLFEHGAGNNLSRNKVFSFVPLFLDGIVVNYNLYGEGRSLIRSKTCAASLNTFGGGPAVLAGVDDATVDLRDFTGLVPGVSGPVHLLVLQADVVAASANVLRLGYHITVVTVEKFVPRMRLDGNFHP
jgi:hypothetical protein